MPHDWSIEQDFSQEHSSGTGYLPGGIGWYRAHVSLADLGPIDDRHVRLVFHGVYKNADVWVNGYHLGGRPSGYAQFSFDLTEILSYAPDDDLVLSVRVEHTDISDSPLVQRLRHHAARRARRCTSRCACASTARPFTTRRRRMPQEATCPDRAGARQRHWPRHARCSVQHELRSLTSGRVHTVRHRDRRCPRGGSADALVTSARCPSRSSGPTPNLASTA